MSDLKATYDRVLKARAERLEIVNKIDAAMLLGTPEGDDIALALKPDLEKADTKVNEMDAIYQQAQNALKGTNIAAQFVPVSGTSPEQPEEKKQKVLNLAAYNQLDPPERLAFAKSGGKIEGE